jgi:glucose-6-phosphate dehydrogenase assembly protein OpcA
VATAAWLDSAERPGVRWRVASDLNWRRLKYWRRLLAQSLEPASAPGAMESVNELRIDHGPHASIQGWLLASWLMGLLGGRVHTGKATPGVEMTWRCVLPKGEARVCLHRLEDGPPTVRRVRIGCTLEGKPTAFVLTRDGPNRLAVELEGSGMAARTITTAGMGAVDLIGRQLSDRERDAEFRASMAIAGVMAQSLIG